MKNHSFSDQDYELWVLFSQARHLLFKAREKELRSHGITATQAAALFVIKAIGNKATATQISQWLLREHHSVSGLLDRMEREGLISRDKDSQTKLVRVALTEKGRHAFYQSAKRESIHKTLRILSKEERQQLRSLLQKLRDEGLKQLVGDLKPPFP